MIVTLYQAMDISVTKWNSLGICFWFFIYNFNLKEVFHFQETGAHVIFKLHITVTLYENLVAMTSNWLLSDCCLLADFDPYVISRLYPDSSSFSQLHVNNNVTLHGKTYTNAKPLNWPKR